jgi:hypothetical protein
MPFLLSSVVGGGQRSKVSDRGQLTRDVLLVSVQQ